MLRLKNNVKKRPDKKAVAVSSDKKIITFDPKTDKGTNEIVREGKLTPLPNTKKRDVIYSRRRF